MVGRSALDPEVWLEKYGDLLFRFALARVNDADVAEDLVQETLVAAFRSVSQFEGRSEVHTWLVSIIRRKIADFFKRMGREKNINEFLNSDRDDFDQRSHDLHHPKLSAKRFESSLEKDEFWATVQECVKRLPPHLRETFLLRVVNEKKPVCQLCEELGITEENFGVRLYRARLMLRDCLEKNWLD